MPISDHTSEMCWTWQLECLWEDDQVSDLCMPFHGCVEGSRRPPQILLPTFLVNRVLAGIGRETESLMLIGG